LEPSWPVQACNGIALPLAFPDDDDDDDIAGLPTTGQQLCTLQHCAWPPKILLFAVGVTASYLTEKLILK
jgi:hypothetical protein